MDNPIHNFEFILKNHNTKRHLTLYTPIKQQDKQKIKPEDVITSVSTQLKAIQVADTVKTENVKKNLPKYKKSAFLSVNKLPVYDELPKRTNKFDTQLILNTQLINIIDNVELIENERGMTQEFETSFCHTNKLVNEDNHKKHLNDDNEDSNAGVMPKNDNFINNCDTNLIDDGEDIAEMDAISDIRANDKDNNTVDNTNRISLNDEKNATVLNINCTNEKQFKDVPDFGQKILAKYKTDDISKEIRNASATDQSSGHDTGINDDINNEIGLRHKIITESKIEEYFIIVNKNYNFNEKDTNNKTCRDISVKIHRNELNDLDSQENEASVSQLLNECIEIDAATEGYTERSPSPVLMPKNMKYKSKSPLVYNLDAFEKFESLAISVVTNYDFERAKHVINSQIIGKELRVNMDEDVALESKDNLRFVLRTTSKPQTNATVSNQKVYEENSLDKEPKAHCSKETHTEEFRPIESQTIFSQILRETVKKKAENYGEWTTKAETDDLDKTRHEIESLSILNDNQPTELSQILPNVKRKRCVNNDNFADKLKLAKKEAVLDPIGKIIESTIDVDKTNRSEFEDEILFSSDEDDFYKRDMPFTCALERSFCDQSEVLDKTMYVGFQTASNRSIQICKDSFDKAKSILSGVDDKTSITELVKFCDENSKDIECTQVPFLEEVKVTVDIEPVINIVYREIESKVSFSIDRNGNKAKSSTINTENVHTDSNAEIDAATTKDNDEMRESVKTNEDINDKIGKSNNLIENNNNFNGFKTASNKNITLSNSALDICKKVFKDIDINANFDNGTETYSKNLGMELIDEKQVQLHSQTVIDFKDTELNAICEDSAIEKDENAKEIEELMQTSINDEEIIQEFENIEMSLEDEKEIEEFRGFPASQTSSNNNIALIKTKAIEEVNGIDMKLHNTDLNVDQFKANNVGFKTASNKKIHISDKVFSDTENMFKDIDCIDIDQLKRNSGGGTFNMEDFNKPSTSKSNFVGFKTANNKDIMISDAALAKTKTIFNDIDSVKIPEKVEKIFNESRQAKTSTEYDIAGFDHSDFETDTDIIKPTTSKMVGFKTANNKQIKISKAALEETKNIFNDIDFITENVNEITEKEDLEKLNDLKNSGKCERMLGNHATDPFHNLASVQANFVGFKTGNNKVIKISDAALERTKNIFNDVDAIDFCVPKTTSKGSNKKEKGLDLNDVAGFTKKIMFIGFKTANNKDIQISESALAKTRSIFNDINSTDLDSANTHEKQIEITPSECSNNKIDRFHKPSNNMTAENQIKAVSIDILNKDFFKTETLNNDKQIIGKEPKFQGFTTASNKRVTISKEALAKTKDLFKNIDNINMEPEKQLITNENDQTSSFKTAINNFVDTTKDYDIPTIDSVPVFKGFHTASNKVVNITEESLAQSREILNDINTDDTKIKTRPIPKNTVRTNDIIGVTDPTFKGFQTANNKVINISEEALTESRKLLKDIEHTNVGEFKGYEKDVLKSDPPLNRPIVKTHDGNERSNNNNIFSFTTGNSKRISITEEALVKSKKIFDENTKDIVKDNDIELDKIIDTQVIHNFEETLYTEDFRPSPVKSKRSGSPILACSTAKKRKIFKTPYSQTVKKNTTKDDISVKVDTTIKYDENYKKNKTIKLTDLQKYCERNAVIDPYLLEFEFGNILQFMFRGVRNDLSSTNMTVDDLKELFLGSVNRRLVPNGWLDNHIKLILWKLISYEIKFPNLGTVCNIINVLYQLKYRYDRELYNAQRPYFRKILEKDDVPSKTMILCVVQIFQDGVQVKSVTNLTSNIELVLTEGWYCIKATTDKMLAKLVYDGKISVGTKIVTNGAELVNCDQGIAPWEDTSSVRLKISGNSTRLARWDARLGCHGNATILSQLSTVKIDGGRVSKLRVYVTRVYPALYVEKLEDGSTVTRSERLEHLHQMKYETERQIMMEKLYEEVEKEFSDLESQDSEGSYSSGKRSCLDSGTQIAKKMKKSIDPAEFRSHLTSSQTHLLESYTSKRREKLLQDVQQRIRDKMESNGLMMTRNVVPVLKIRVAGVEERGGRAEVTKGMMSIWKPNEAIIEVIKEGTWIDVINVFPTAIRYSEIQISAGRSSIFSQSKYKEPDKIKSYTNLLNRKCFTVKELSQNPTISTDYNEIDTVGLVFQIDPPMNEFESTKSSFQNVYITDLDKYIICVNFWGGLKKFGYENVLDTGQVVACGNLQKRVGNTRKYIPQYRVTEFTHFTKTPKNVNARNILESLNKVFMSLDRRKFCEDCVVLKNNYTVNKQYNNENISPYRPNNISLNMSKAKAFIDSPLARNDDNFNLTGLDFESTFKQSDTQDLPREILLRKKRVNEKITKLKMYGEPPPLSPVLLLNKTKNACNSYKSPLIDCKNSDSSINVAKLKNNTEMAVNLNTGNTSPVLNRTYVKSVNPVKLNFDEQNDEGDTVDQFADDFDGSPPLSLD